MLVIDADHADSQTAGGLMVHSQQVHKCDPEP